MDAYKPGERRIGNFKPARRGALDRAGAEGIAAVALAEVAAQPEWLMRFVNDSGIDPATLLARAGDAEVLQAVLEFVLADEPLLLTIAANTRLAPEQFAAAFAILQAS